MKTSNISIYISGIIACVLYFFSVMLFLVFKTDILLTIWEIMTIIGGFVILIVVLKMIDDLKIEGIYRTVTQIMASAMLILTTLAHSINLLVTRPLIKNGVDIPIYLQIGYWPSVEMAVDYLAWGLFMGLSFLGLYLAIKNNGELKSLKRLLLVVSSLCLIGFIGIFVHENLWYFAPIGYGFGKIYLCFLMIKQKNLNKLVIYI